MSESDTILPSFISFARQSPGLQITPSAVLVTEDGQMVPSNKTFSPAVTAIKVGASQGKVTIFIPMIFFLRIPNQNSPVSPLILYVTPSDISVARRKALTEHTVRQGTIREEWGDELDVWTCSGQIAAFYSPTSGLTQVRRNETATYKNFLSLLSFVKNNGRSYYTRGKASKPGDVQRERLLEINRSRAFLDRGSTRSKLPSLQPILKNRKDRQERSLRKEQRELFRKSVLFEPSRIIKHVGSVEIAYDLRILSGHFDSFEWDDNVDHPHNINYSFTFTVKRQYDLAAQITGSGIVNG